MELTAAKFTERLMALRSDEELQKHRRYFKLVPEDENADDYFIGIRMGRIFALGKEYDEMSVTEIETLMESPIHELRVGP